MAFSTCLIRKLILVAIVVAELVWLWQSGLLAALRALGLGGDHRRAASLDGV